MADANTLIALMELSDDLEIEMSFFEDEEEITVLSCAALYMRRNLNRIEGFLKQQFLDTCQVSFKVIFA